MTKQQALLYIQNLHSRGICPGLSRMRQALDALGNPENRLQVVHIAGTNGKGSTAEMIRCIATAGGYKCGLYTSPTVTTLADTITIDGAPIPGDTLATLTETVKNTGVSLTEFEFVTALSLLWFANEQVDLAVIECGLGGREDATNVFPAPLAAVFTSISLDHTNLLGNSVEAIAVQKVGIMKAPCAVISSPKQPPEALEVIRAEAARQGLTLCLPDDDCKALKLAMQGVHQRANALTAIAAGKALAERGFPLSDDAIAKGLATAVLPCRQERINADIPVLLDGAHNPDGVAALTQTVKELWADTPVVLLTGMLADKNVAACAALLKPLAVKVVCCTPEHPDRALPAEALAAYYDNATACADISAAFETAYTLAKNQNLPLIAAGSFYVAAAVRKLIV